MLTVSCFDTSGDHSWFLDLLVGNGDTMAPVSYRKGQCLCVEECERMDTRSFIVVPVSHWGCGHSADGWVVFQNLVHTVVQK